MDWFEIVSENFIDTEGRPLHFLDQIAERYPIAMHGVCLSVGSTDPIDFEFLDKLKALVEARASANWLGDHICWTGVNGVNGHDLYPVPYTEEGLRHMVSRVKDDPGLPRAAAGAREPVDLLDLRVVLDARGRIHRATRRRGGLRLTARRQQRLCDLPEPRPRPGRLSRGDPLRACRADPPRGPHRQRHALHRHARRAGDRRGLGALRARARADRRARDAARVGCEDSEVFRSTTGGRQGRTVPEGRAPRKAAA